jgi:hypothetical protein
MAQSDQETDIDLNSDADLFQDPADYYPPTPPPTTQSYTTLAGDTITLHLVGRTSKPRFLPAPLPGCLVGGPSCSPLIHLLTYPHHS